MTKRFLPSEAQALSCNCNLDHGRPARLFKSAIVLFAFILSAFYSIAQAPVANFTSNRTSGCAPLSVTFQDQSTGDPKFWNWDLGNGQLSTLQNPSTVYSTPGTYTITLVARNANGTHGVTKTNYITVYPQPLASMTADKTIACVPASIQFTDASQDTSGGTINSWQWDFGDGTYSTQQNPQKSYSTPGFYSVFLTVTSSTGCSTTVGNYRYIRVVSGTAADFLFTADTVCRSPFGITFLNQTSGPGQLTYTWDFGNSTSSTQQNPTTAYNTTGTYNVQLIATSEYGCADTIVKPVAVTGANTGFNAPDSACLNRPVNFTNASTPTATSTFWDFGDGTTSTLANPVKTFTTPGTYEVKMYNTYANCADSLKKFITILPIPTVDFSADNLYACKGPFTVNFTDNSPNAVAWLWNFGDGNTSTLRNPSHTYLNDGQYTVTLQITTSFGCTGSTSKTSYIRIEKPIVSISNVPTGGCIPFDFSPVANVISLDGVATYFWDFGHLGSTSNVQSPTYTYTDSGTYTVKLRITTIGGCTDSAVVVNAVRTGPPPTVDFTVSNDTACASSSITFTDLSNPADRWEWDFGDGSRSTAQNPVHTYTDTGSFTVTLTAYNNGCARSVTKTQFITVRPPVANFSDSVNCANKYTVFFTNRSLVNPIYGPVTYLWQFGDPANSTSTAANPTFTYPALGTYNVRLTVTNGACAHTITLPVKLVAELADFTANKTTACKDETVIFDAINSNPANVAQYHWVIDGRDIIGQRGTRLSFPNNGSYSVTLTITDLNGCTDTKTVNNYITITGPVASFNAPDTGGCKNSNITFTDQSTPAGTIRQWQWDFGDGQSQTYTAPPFTHNYRDTGLFNVKLTVTDNIGCTHDTTISSMIRITEPQAMFKAAATKFCPGGELQFTDTSKGYITAWHWDFGDGNTSNLKNPIHIYTGPDAMYTVKLTVTDTTGCTDTITKVNYIDVKRPKPSFTMSDSASICPPLETRFFIGGSDYESYLWDFGDGQTSNLRDPRHFFNSYGTFEVKLYVAGYGGCVDSAVKTVNVYDPYTATDINYTPLEGCNAFNVDFNITTPPNTTFHLHFGDNGVDSSQASTLTHYYSMPSFYTPMIILKDRQDCEIRIGGPDQIKVFGAMPFFGMDRKSFCDTGVVYFTNYTITNDTIVSSVWNFGDNVTSTDEHAIHTFSAPGTYYPTLTVETIRGCVRSIQDTVLVYRTPDPFITVADPVCIGSPVLLQANLAQPDTAITWKWTFNGQNSAQQNVTTTYNSTGSKAITLEAANKIGCKDTTSTDITVVPLPVINIVADPVVILGTGSTIPVTYSPNAMLYNWTPPTNLSCANCPNPYANPKFTTKYNVVVTDSNGCVASRDITVTVVCNNNNYFIPNTFSPNGDGQNDVFYVRGRSIDNVQSLRIFNRWGQMVFERRNFNANDPSSGWNGLINGKPADPDVYVYVAEVICENATIIPLRGNVALIR